MLLHYIQVNIKSKEARIIHIIPPGDSTTTMCHRYTPPEQLRHFVKTAGILVVATGIVCPNIADIHLFINITLTKISHHKKIKHVTWSLSN